MANRFANGKNAFGFCDVCSFRFPLRRLKNLVVKTKETQIKACPQCWTPDQPQLQLGMYPISDPQAIRDPRPDTNTWYQSGVNAIGNVSEGMLVTQWGWGPIGGARDFTDPLTPNALVGVGQVGQVTSFAPWTSLLFTTPGTYSWTAPVGVTQVYVLCVGGGGSGRSIGGPGAPGGDSSFDTFFAGGGAGSISSLGGAGGTGTTLSATVFGGNGGAGGNYTVFPPGGGGGAGGYAGAGGAGSAFPSAGGTGVGGAAGGGSSGISLGAGGGGVGLNGQGASGAGGTTVTGGYGFGGSGGQNGDANGNGGLYGGGGGGNSSFCGGGGGGGLRWTFLPVVPGTTYPVVVGAGGVAPVGPSGGNGAVRIDYLLVP